MSMSMTRRGGLCALGAAGVAVSLGAMAQPAAYPAQPIRLLVPYPAGGGSDYLARLLAPLMAQRLGQSLYVENRPGGGGTVGAAAVTRIFPADGYTVLLSDSNPLVVQSYDPLPYLAPVTLAARYDFILVSNPAVLRANNVKELVSESLASASGLNYASPGVGTTHHMGMELFARDSGARVVSIPYKGGGAALQDLLAGQVALMFLDRVSARQYIESGKLRAIGVAGARRVPSMPNVPTIAEQGVTGFEVEGWLGFSVRKGTRPEVIQALHTAYASVSTDTELHRKVDDAGINLISTTPKEFASFRSAYMAKWKKLIADRGLRPE